MSKANYTPVQLDEDNMLPEYDFSKGVRGKHHQAYRQGYLGARGTYAPPALRIAKIAMYNSGDLGNNNPTLEPHLTPCF